MSTVGCQPRRLIEVDLPIKRISAHARREKSIRHGHISTMHIWWARRPLSSCRAIICAGLWPDPADPHCPSEFILAAREEMLEWSKNYLNLFGAESFERFVGYQKNPKLLNDCLVLRSALFDFISDFSNWDNSNNIKYLHTSNRLTTIAHESLGGVQGTRPLIADPFAGGGSIPLESLRVGADAFGSDLNPVPVLLNKVILEYIPKFGQRLADEVERKGKQIKLKIDKDLRDFYPDDHDGNPPIAYIWARTVLSESPGGDYPVEIPLVRSMWLSNKPKRLWAFRWIRNHDGEVKTEIIKIRYVDGIERMVRRPLLEIFKPEKSEDVEDGTSKAGAATCPVTGFTNSVESVREQLKLRKGGASDARLLCIVQSQNPGTGRVYRIPQEADLIAVAKAKIKINELVSLENKEIPLLPDGKLNHLRGFFNIVLYGMTSWGDLFSPRQALGLCKLVEYIQTIKMEYQNDEIGDAVQTCLALALDRCADKCASVVVWNIPGEKVEHVFGRQALPMVWDFAEANILSEIGWSGACEWVQKVIANISSCSLSGGTAAIASATKHPLPDNIVDAVITDPPYYAAIPYADLSDFFYSWLKRTVGNIHQELFWSPLTPKDEECVQLSHRAAMYRNKDAMWFESMMTKACMESRRITKPNGISIFVFANKETSGWEAMLAALISAGWVITASWPIDTEMGTRLRARNSAVLASSVHLVCRPREASLDPMVEIGDWREILSELPRRIHEWMPRLAEEGVVGADAIFACLGPALEIFSRFSRVEKASGELVTLKEYLEQVWGAVAKEALSMVFEGASAEGFEPDSRLTAMWLWTLSASASSEMEVEANDDSYEENSDGPAKHKSTGFLLDFDAARKIAQGLGADLESLPNLVLITGETANLLPVAERAAYLFGKTAAEPLSPRPRGRQKQEALPGFEELVEGIAGLGLAEGSKAKLGQTVLDRVHQAMLLFGAGRSEAVKALLVDEGVGQDVRFWRLAQAFSALYPRGTQEKRWVDGVLSRKKALGF